MSLTRNRESIKVNARRNSVARQPIDNLDSSSKRQAKRIIRQQKRLEREVGLDCTVIDINQNVARQKIVRLEDIKEIKPLTDTQEDFFESYMDSGATGYLLYGSAGTGKTMLAVYHAIVDVLDPEVKTAQRVVIVRSSVQSRQQGHLPGSEDEKMAVFEAPYASTLSFLTGKKDAYEKLKDMGKVQFESTSFLRGETFDDCVVILDEAQNCTWEELSTVATRIGKNSRLIVCGDTKQNDLHFNKNDQSGFAKFIEVSRVMPEFRNFKFTSDDIVRSGFVKSFIIACERLGV